MAERYVIVVGDPTTGGGTAIEGLSTFHIECLDGSSRPVVCVGHAVVCDQCGPTVVAEGVTFFFSNHPAAFDGCSLACGHRLVSVNQRNVSVELANRSGVSDAYTNLSSALMSRTHLSAFDLRFLLNSAKSGGPIAGLRYRITLESGKVFEGTTDAFGLTQSAHSDLPETATIEVIYAEESTGPAARTDSCGC